MSGHRERLVKVNAFVDEGVASLVEALSGIDGLVTLESCQGDQGVKDAFVIFRLGTWRAVGQFLFERFLPSLPPDVRAATSVRIQAYDEEMAHGSITVEPCAVSAVAECVRAVSDAKLLRGSHWTDYLTGPVQDLDAPLT
jgi:hypothetical protein